MALHTMRRDGKRVVTTNRRVTKRVLGAIANDLGLIQEADSIFRPENAAVRGGRQKERTLRRGPVRHHH